MTATFLDQLAQATNETTTANGDVAYRSTLDANLDFFSRAGAMRKDAANSFSRYATDPGDAVKLWKKAYAEDPQLALRNLFYVRDIRGGQGEREIFRLCLTHVPEDVLAKNLGLISEYGRWDDILALPVNQITDLIATQLSQDIQNMNARNPVSLLAKWMPSENTSSVATRKKATQLRKALKLTPRQYRQMLVTLRRHIHLLEQDMSSGNWKGIDYSKVPSQAHSRHTKAFRRHDNDRYTAYLESVSKGETKINTSTLYTYEVYDMVRKDEAAADAMWLSLPDYTSGQNALVIADVSGSMIGRPMSVSVSLALYFAERNKGTFNGYFMTFSDNPQLVKVQGNTLSERLRNIEHSNWGMSTNIEAAFDAILTAAINAKADQSELPSILYIITDGQFNEMVKLSGKSAFHSAQQKFVEAGYVLPHVVFWNVNAWQSNSPATKFDDAVTLISGSSQSTFRYAVEGTQPIDLMLEVLNSARYQPITV